MTRAQFSLEFLMTYGWAFLIVSIAIGSLAYFGVFDAQKMLPEKCIFENGFICDDFGIMQSDGHIHIHLTNTQDQQVVGTNVGTPAGSPTPIITVLQGPTTCTFNSYSSNIGGQDFDKAWTLDKYQRKEIVIQLTSCQFTSGTLKLKFEFPYKFDANGFPHVGVGEILVKKV